MARYSCQVNLPRFGEVAQHRLEHASVLIIGMGGLGCPVAQYLVSSGVGTIGLVDNDSVSVSNLHRQILYDQEDIGKMKVLAAKEKLQKQNPSTNITAYDVYVDADIITTLIQPFDIIVDCTDNFDTKYLINDACVLSDKPLVFGAIYQYEGQASVFNTTNPDGSKSTNYRDIFPDVNAAQIPNCADGGVIPTLAGIIGSIQANEVIKYITHTGELLANKMLILDALNMQSRIIKTGHATKTNIASLHKAYVPIISIQDLRIKLEHEHIELIDVRNAEEHEHFSIGGRNIPLDQLNSYIPGMDRQTEIVCYCATGKRSAEAVKLILKRFPDAKVSSLKNGIGQRELHHG